MINDSRICVLTLNLFYDEIIILWVNQFISLITIYCDNWILTAINAWTCIYNNNYYVFSVINRHCQRNYILWSCKKNLMKCSFSYKIKFKKVFNDMITLPSKIFLKLDLKIVIEIGMKLFLLECYEFRMFL